MKNNKNLGKVGFRIRGDYIEGDVYEMLDVVYFNNSSYASKYNNNVTDPTNNEYWQVLIADSSDLKNYTNTTELTKLLNNKQDVMIAGLGIKIGEDGKTISIDSDDFVAKDVSEVSIGLNSAAYGVYSVAIGGRAQSAHSYSSVIGCGYSKYDYETTLASNRLRVSGMAYGTTPTSYGTVNNVGIDQNGTFVIDNSLGGSGSSSLTAGVGISISTSDVISVNTDTIATKSHVSNEVAEINKSTLIGEYAYGYDDKSIAIGHGARSTRGIAIGTYSYAGWGEYNIAINGTAFYGGISIGGGTARGYSIVIGQNDIAQYSYNTIVIGKSNTIQPSGYSNYGANAYRNNIFGYGNTLYYMNGYVAKDFTIIGNNNRIENTPYGNVTLIGNNQYLNYFYGQEGGIFMPSVYNSDTYNASQSKIVRIAYNGRLFVSND